MYNKLCARSFRPRNLQTGASEHASNEYEISMAHTVPEYIELQECPILECVGGKLYELHRPEEGEIARRLP